MAVRQEFTHIGGDMALRQIVKVGDDILRMRAKEVTEFNDKLAILIDDMFETMVLSQGVGLAAPQVGIIRRICVVCVDGKTRYELVNPVVIKKSGTQRGSEGCLSVPNRHGTVERPKKMIVEAYDRTGKKFLHKVDGYTAVAFSHEMDHLDGVLFIDKVIDEAQ